MIRRYLITGVTGLMGLNLSLLYSKKSEVAGVSNTRKLGSLPYESVQCDLVRADVDQLLDDVRPQALIHCAAMANIDSCEKSPDEAFLVNGELPGRLAYAAGKRGIRMLHISTDAVFDGIDSGLDGYREDDTTAPINVYAASKLAGEKAVLENNPDAVIARVNFYGWSAVGNRSLAEIFYNNLSAGKPMMGFTDVFFTPLYVGRMAEIFTALLEGDASGIYHVFSSDYQSKYSFGASIAKRFGFDPALISPVSWRDAGLTAVRSPNLIMNTDKLRTYLGSPLPNQEECLESFYNDRVNGLAASLPAYCR